MLSAAKYNTDETADAIVQLLDKDKDGQVTLDDIVEYAREKAQEEAQRDHRYVLLSVAPFWVRT